MGPPPPTYTRDEMDAILKRAIERQQAKSEEIAHEDLVAAAGEVGIPREEVEAAARDLEAEKARTKAQPAPRREPREAGEADVTPEDGRGPATQYLMRRAVTYFATILFFGFIGQATHAHWVAWPILGLTLSFCIQFWHVSRGRDPRDAVAWRAERRQARRERRRLRRLERLEDFEHKVQIGADALFRVIDEVRTARGRTTSDAQGAERAPERVRVDAREADVVEREAPSERETRRNRGA